MLILKPEPARQDGACTVAQRSCRIACLQAEEPVQLAFQGANHFPTIRAWQHLLLTTKAGLTVAFLMESVHMKDLQKHS